MELNNVVAPQLFLRGVDVVKVITSYRNGNYQRFILPAGKLKLPTLPSTPSYLQNNSHFMIFTIPGRGEVKQLISNSIAYETFTTTGQPLVGGSCNYCRDTFTTPRLGIALQFIECEYAADALPVSLRSRNFAKVYVVHYESCNCSFECALAEYNRRKSSEPAHGYYAETEKSLRYLFSLSYPGQELIPANDYLLHKNFGGPLSTEEFHARSHRYIQLPQIIWAPVKGVYEQR